MFLEGMGAIFEVFNAKMVFFKHSTFACFALFFTIFSILIREISKIRFWVQFAVSVPRFEISVHEPQEGQYL